MKVAILGPTSSADIWNLPISWTNHFIKLGHDVRFYNTMVDDTYSELNLIKLIQDYKNRVFSPDIVFHLDFGLFRSELLTKASIPTAKWIGESGDDPQNINLNFSKFYKKNFDLILSPDIRCVQYYNNNGENAVWCPYFADPDEFEGVVQDPIWDAVTTRSIVEPFFSELKEHLLSRFEARTDYLYSKDHSRHLMKGRIVVQNSKYKEISRRLFEGMLAKRMVITDRPDPNTCINEIFTENVDIVYFDSVQECADKIKYFTSPENEKLRLQIAENGYQKVIKHHTTASRIKHILKII